MSEGERMPFNAAQNQYGATEMADMSKLAGSWLEVKMSSSGRAFSILYKNLAKDEAFTQFCVHCIETVEDGRWDPDSNYNSTSPEAAIECFAQVFGVNADGVRAVPWAAAWLEKDAVERDEIETKIIQVLGKIFGRDSEFNMAHKQRRKAATQLVWAYCFCCCTCGFTICYLKKKERKADEALEEIRAAQAQDPMPVGGYVHQHAAAAVSALK